MNRRAVVSVLFSVLLFSHSAAQNRNAQTPAPLSLRVALKKDRIVYGESIVLEIEQRTAAAIEMETVEMNRDRTRIRVVPESKPGSARVLSGTDHISLHAVDPLTPLGRAFRAPAGQVWKVDLNLLDYTRPLPPGRYRLEVSYRWNDSAQVTANSVRVEVVPAKPIYQHHRWFGGSKERELLRSISAVSDRGSTVWLYRQARSFDPGVLEFATDLGLGIPPAAAPRLAHLNDIGTAQFNSYAVWIEKSRLCWQAVQLAGRTGGAECTDSGLSPNSEPRLADPPLQLRGGGLMAVLTGTGIDGRPAAALISVTATTRVVRRTVPLAATPDLRGAVAWAGDDEPHKPILFYAAGSKVRRANLDSGKTEELNDVRGKVLHLMTDQWLGRGRVWAFGRQPTVVTADAWDFDSLTPVLRKDSPARPGASPLLDAVTFGSDASEYALLFDDEPGWILVTAAGEQKMEWNGVSPRLIGSPAGIYLMRPTAQFGFKPERLR